MSMWSQTRELAGQTPADRNRYVDFLRAMSIAVVVAGHWLIVAVHFDRGSLTASDMLVVDPDLQWLTWLFQVMPIFFIVGGYSNAASLDSARRLGMGYGDWLAGRLYRLVSPLLILVVGWGALAAALFFAGVSGEVTRLGSRAALIPTWFLAVYIGVVLFAPLAFAAWRRWGYGSFWMLAAAAVLSDACYFGTDVRWLGWGSYLWVWLGVHQLGYAWYDGRLGTPSRSLAWAVLGWLALAALILYGPYPIAMVGSPDETLSNTQPPKITLVALAIGQLGLLLAVEAPMQSALQGARLWTATVLVNSMIMTVYLWHLTVMVVVISLAYLAGGVGLRLVPGTVEWWWSRPLWIAALAAVLIPVALLLSPLERRPRSPQASAPSAARQVAGAVLLCLGVALLALFGFGDAPWPMLDIIAFLLVMCGAAASGLLPVRLRAQPPA